MTKVDALPASRPAILSILLALVSVGIALSTLFIASAVIKIVMLVVLAATGASLAIVLAQPRSPAQR